MKYSKIRKNLNQVRRKTLTQLNTELTNAALISLLSFENKIFAARLCYIQIRKSQTASPFLLEKLFGIRIFLNQRRRRQEAYEYFFFTCCRKIYDELRLLSGSNLFKSEIEREMFRIENLKNQRDSQEHGSEDIWNLMHKLPKKEQSKAQFARKARKAGDFNFYKNMELLDSVYDEISSILLA